MNTYFASHASLDVDLAPALQVVKLIVLLNLENAVDRTDFNACLTASAVVGRDNGEFFREFFARSLLGHERYIGRRGSGRRVFLQIEDRSRNTAVGQIHMRENRKKLSKSTFEQNSK